MRILGLDYGDKTVGVAVSDDLLLTAQGLEVIRRADAISIKKTIFRLSEIIKEYNVTRIVLGFPLRLDNTQGDRCAKTLDFKARLERNFKKVPVELWDERLSTKAADRHLESLSKTQRDFVIDKMAAVIILQDYLDANYRK